MTTFLFVRHGETDWNREGRYQGARDIPLNEDGRQQALALAAVWDEGGDVLISSPLSRAWETAQILGRVLGLEPRADKRLIERSYGEGEGLTLAERAERFPAGIIPGLETTDSLLARARGFLDDHTLAHPGRRIAVVSHGGFINAVLSLVSDGAVGTGRSLLGNASVSRVTYNASGWSVDTVGRLLKTPVRRE